jgi:hypothetical protein
MKYSPSGITTDPAENFATGIFFHHGIHTDTVIKSFSRGSFGKSS